MAILTCKQTCECISLQIFSKYPIQKSRDPTNPPDFPTLKAYPTPGIGGRFGFFSLKWRERMNLKVPGAILPLGCAILSTRAKTVRGVGTTLPLGELGLNRNNRIIIFFYVLCILHSSSSILFSCFPNVWFLSYYPSFHLRVLHFLHYLYCIFFYSPVPNFLVIAFYILAPLLYAP